MNLMHVDEWYVKMFKWNENPFTFKILPDVFVGYSDEVERINEGIKNNEKILLLIGPTGSGKTTLLKYLINNTDMKIVYLPKPPKNPDEIVIILKSNLTGKVSRFFSREINLYNIDEWANKKLAKKKMVFIIDECHEADIDTMEWIRTIADQVDNMQVIISGLPVLETMLKERLETFMKRINVKVELTNLTKSEMREMMKRRIEYVGGDDIKPFTSDAIDFIYEKTMGFPREVLRMCGDILFEAYKKGITTIDASLFKEKKREERVSMDIIKGLPLKQREILEILNKHRELTPTDMVGYLNKDSYKSFDNAIRSVNNILRRLMADNFVERKKVGKAYKYSTTNRIKTMMVNG